MAIFGRRQPHAPIVLRGQLPAQRPVGRCVVVGQKTGQNSADRYFRRTFAPKIVRGGGRAPVGQVVSPRGQPEARAAAERFFHRQFPPQVVRGGGPPAVGRGLIVGQKTGQQAAQRYYHPQFAPVQKEAGPPAPTARLVFARGGVAPAADRYFRRSFPPTVRRPGPPPSVARQVTVQRVSQPAARRPEGSALILPPRVVSQPVTNPPVGRTLLFGTRAGQHAADRYFRRSFPPTRKGAGAPASVARLLSLPRAAHAAAQRYYRPDLTPLIKTAGPAPAAGRAVVVQRASQPAARRPDSFALSLAPRVVAAPSPAPVGRSFVVSQACRASADRYACRAFAPVRKTMGAPPAVARSVTVQKVSQPAARRPEFATTLLRPSVPRVAAPPAGKALLFGRLAGQRAAERYFRPQLAPARKARVATPAAGVHSVLSITDNGDGTGGVATVSGSDGSLITVYSAPFTGSLGALSWTAAATRTGDGTVAVNPGLGGFFWYAAGASTPPQFSNFVFQSLSSGTVAPAEVVLLADAAAAAVLAAWLTSDNPPGAGDGVERVYEIPIADAEYLEALTGRHVWVFPAEYGRTAISRRQDDLHPKIAVVIAERYADQAPVPTAWLDERVAFVQAAVFFPLADPRRAQLLEGVTPVDDGASVVTYDAELLVHQKLFLSFVVVQYRQQFNP